MFFPPMTPEMAEYLAKVNMENARKAKNIPTFDEYYNKRYQEEVNKLCKTPSISFGFGMVLASLPKYVKKIAAEEYDKLYRVI